MVRLAPVLHVLGLVVALLGLTMLLPLAVAAWFADGAFGTFVSCSTATASLGFALWLATRRASRGRELQVRDGFLLVALVWALLPAFAMLPLLMQIDGMSLTDAYFEAVSGLTTTGATVLSGLDRLPPSINFWRMFLVWVGGMGVVVLAVAILPLLGVGGSQVFKAETPGPMKDTKLTPRITQTAKALWAVYALLTGSCMIAFLYAGMSWFDALVHAFTTVALGGFSSHDDSFGFFASPTVEWVGACFMLLAGVNFATHFGFLRTRDPRIYLRDPEAWLYFVIMIAGVLLVAVYIWHAGTYADFVEALRHASFNVVSVATTTGFASTDYNAWPMFAGIVMIFMSCFVTSSGSTGGGIKLIRAMLLWKQAFRELRRIVHPRAYIPVKLGGQPVENNIIFAVLAFAMFYGSTVAVCTLLMLFSGLDVVTAFTAVVACINNMGPGLNQVGPASTYAVLSDFQTWVCTAAMLLGRLELFTLIVVFTPSFWRQ